MEVEQLLTHLSKPVLLVVAETVNGPKDADIARVDLQMLVGKVEAAVEPDGSARFLVKYRHPLIRQASLQHHLGRVLQMEQNDRLPAIVIGRVERRNRTFQRREGLPL
jgi:hypothetical protein